MEHTATPRSINTILNAAAYEHGIETELAIEGADTGAGWAPQWGLKVTGDNDQSITVGWIMVATDAARLNRLAEFQGGYGYDANGEYEIHTMLELADALDHMTRSEMGTFARLLDID